MTCTSFFGCELWRFNNDFLDKICTAWRRGVRRIWSLHYNVHRRLLPLLCTSFDIFDQFCVRFLSFARRCISDQSSVLVRSIATQALMCHRAHSPFGYNFIYCSRRFFFNLTDFVNCNNFVSSVEKLNRIKFDDSTIATCRFLRKLIDLRDGVLHFSDEAFFTNSELSFMVNVVSSV